MRGSATLRLLLAGTVAGGCVELEWRDNAGQLIDGAR